MNTVEFRTYNAPPFCEKEALRYAGCKEADEEILKLLYECKKQADEVISYKVCYMVLPFEEKEDKCDFGCFSVSSKLLLKNFGESKEVLLFAATLGAGLDRLIAKYSKISPSKALMLQGIGAERIEALCDAFCEEFEETNKVKLKPRFSPGYGDLELVAQKEIFAVLDCPRKIGLTLNDSLLMSPSKSVTAFAAITENKPLEKINKCTLCRNVSCEFRR